MTGNSILGIGVDLVETERMSDVLSRWGTKFRDRVFLVDEQQYCDTRPVPSRHYAGRFAVKEAVSKAFGTGMGPHIGWLDIEVVRDQTTGAPSVRLGPKAHDLARKRNVFNIMISLAHTRHYAMAQAVITGAQTDETGGTFESRHD